MGEHQGVARIEIRLDLALVEIRLDMVRQQDHDDLGSFGGVRNGKHFQSRPFRLGPGLGTFVQADDDVESALQQVQRVRVSLAAVADDGDFLPLKQVEVAVRLVVDCCGHWVSNVPFKVGDSTHFTIAALCQGSEIADSLKRGTGSLLCLARAIAIAPERTISRSP